MAGPVLVVFGITGDLSRRKLLPALYHLFSNNQLPADTKIVGLSRRELTPHDLLNTVELCVLAKDKVCDPDVLKKLETAMQTLQVDPGNESDFQKLSALLHEIGKNRELLFYMSVPANAFKQIVVNLAEVGLNSDNSRLLIEKPFGRDQESAEDLIELTSKSFTEEQIYRIDHYLAKETAQNLLAFRMHNPIFAPIWKSEHIKTVHIQAKETIGIEGRAAFYEQTGAVRDLIQSHLLQLLAITLMDAPPDMSSEAIHANKAAFLRQVLPAEPEGAFRGQYEGYRQEVENPDSFVETYANVRLKHSSERWHDTNFILETGKALDEKNTSITIEFRMPHETRRNDLVFQLQPNEGISLGLLVKEPGLESRMRHTSLGFRYDAVFHSEPQVDAYERVLMDAIHGDQSLFASDEEILETWRILQPLLDAWQTNGSGLKLYPAGSAKSE
jgi:glucose-6-phosphate 1-dehydrogenase